MSRARILYLPGNGHAPVRLQAARPVLEAAGLDLVEAPDPLRDGEVGGDDGFDAWLTALTHRLESETSYRGAFDLVHASGIGALVALSLRARGVLHGTPVVFQGPVLWGLEKRRFPRMMRRPPFPTLLAWLFRQPRFQRRFARKYFESTPDEATLAAFFEGYADRDAFLAWFRWLSPELLRRLEARFAERPEGLADIRVWIGERDHVVGERELDWTHEALGVRWPVSRHPTWGHYPMMDEPADWARELGDALAATGATR